jgi:hypothetical protein
MIRTIVEAAVLSAFVAMLALWAHIMAPLAAG